MSKLPKLERKTFNLQINPNVKRDKNGTCPENISKKQ